MEERGDRVVRAFIDLHLHLDGSLSLDNIKKLARLQNISLDMSDGELMQRLTVGDNCKDLNEYLEKFDFPLRFLQTKIGISEAVFTLLSEIAADGAIYAEIRFAPAKHTLSGLSQMEAVSAAIDGVKRSKIRSNLILCCMRGGKNDSANTENNIETVRVAGAFLGKGVSAIDLAGAEALYPTAEHEYVFSLAKELGVPFTVHAGEADGADSVLTALNFGASRIGHGVRAIEDIKVISLIVEKNIPLEVCPTSNVNTSLYSSISEHPIKRLMDMGACVTVNTDNMSVSATSVRKELEKLSEAFGFGEDDIRSIMINAARSAFADEITKRELLLEIEKSYGDAK